MTNILDDFYLPLLEQEKHYLSKEYKLLQTSHFREKIALSTVHGIEDYFKNK